MDSISGSAMTNSAGSAYVGSKAGAGSNEVVSATYAGAGSKGVAGSNAGAGSKAAAGGGATCGSTAGAGPRSPAAGTTSIRLRRSSTAGLIDTINPADDFLTLNVN